ncbi:hypothetical protein ABW21_db0202008 [Orbilia brochopaga]|nr:hypothetical protein ABW21_db0202008 [Drechslerella brochopaga]
MGLFRKRSTSSTTSTKLKKPLRSGALISQPPEVPAIPPAPVHVVDAATIPKPSFAGPTSRLNRVESLHLNTTSVHASPARTVVSVVPAGHNNSTHNASAGSGYAYASGPGGGAAASAAPAAPGTAAAEDGFSTPVSQISGLTHPSDAAAARSTAPSSVDAMSGVSSFKRAVPPPPSFGPQMQLNGRRISTSTIADDGLYPAAFNQRPRRPSVTTTSVVGSEFDSRPSSMTVTGIPANAAAIAPLSQYYPPPPPSSVAGSGTIGTAGAAAGGHGHGPGMGNFVRRHIHTTFLRTYKTLTLPLPAFVQVVRLLLTIIIVARLRNLIPTTIYLTCPAFLIRTDPLVPVNVTLTLTLTLILINGSRNFHPARHAAKDWNGDITKGWGTVTPATEEFNRFVGRYAKMVVGWGDRTPPIPARNAVNQLTWPAKTNTERVCGILGLPFRPKTAPATVDAFRAMEPEPDLIDQNQFNFESNLELESGASTISPPSPVTPPAFATTASNDPRLLALTDDHRLPLPLTNGKHFESSGGYGYPGGHSPEIVSDSNPELVQPRPHYPVDPSTLLNSASRPSHTYTFAESNASLYRTETQMSVRTVSKNPARPVTAKSSIFDSVKSTSDKKKSKGLKSLFSSKK